MSNRKQLKGVKRHRKFARHPKHNKKSVNLRKKLRQEKLKREIKQNINLENIKNPDEITVVKDNPVLNCS